MFPSPPTAHEFNKLGIWNEHAYKAAKHYPTANLDQICMLQQGGIAILMHIPSSISISIDGGDSRPFLQTLQNSKSTKPRNLLLMMYSIHYTGQALPLNVHSIKSERICNNG